MAIGDDVYGDGLYGDSGTGTGGGEPETLAALLYGGFTGTTILMGGFDAY